MRYQYSKSESAVAASQYYSESEYWTGKLSGDLIKVTFPYDHDRADLSESAGIEFPLESREFTFPAEVSSLLLKLSNDSDIRLHIILVAGITALLHKYTGINDIIVGSPVLKQQTDDNFINTVLILRNWVQDTMSFRELLIQVRKTIADATMHQNYPIETLLYQLDIPFSENDYFSLTDVAVILENIHDKKYIDHIHTNTTFSFLNTGEIVNGVLEYNPVRYLKTRIEKIIDHLIRLMHRALLHLDSRMSGINIQSDEERKQLLYDFNDTATGYPAYKTIHQLFEQQVEKTPGGTAVGVENRWLTYEALNKKSNQLARILKANGITPDTIIALMLENSMETIIGILGVLKSGGAYLPIDPQEPEARKSFIIKDSRTRALLIQQYLLDKEHTVTQLFPAQDILTPDNQGIYSADTSGLNSRGNPGNLSYIIYTSGTTGKPKGVMVEHRGLVNYIWWAAKKYVKNEPVNFPFYSNLSFDLTVTSIFTPLITGGSIMVYAGEGKEFLLDKIIEENKVGIIKLTPSHLKLLRLEIHENSKIKRFIVGGEAFETQLATDIVRGFAGNIELYNEYGPTEAVVGCMFYKFIPGKDNTKTVPIGLPADNVQIYILDKNKGPVPPGVVGELYISGNGISRGYLNRPELTAERYIKNPFVPGKYMYKTGDSARHLGDGNIEFSGRIDQQMKIRGFRIEPGEIKSKLMEYKKNNPIMISDEDVKGIDPKNIQRCQQCLLSSNYPGIHFNENGVCNICMEYETYKDKVNKYFKGSGDFKQLVAETKKTNQAEYDCLLLFSGGKDSSYVLYQLVDMGLKVLTFTFDNGYISDAAFANIKRITSAMAPKVENIVRKAKNMNKVFVESLNSTHGVCHGCWNALNALAVKIAHEKGINLIISGLSRGQIFEMRLEGLFKQGIFTEREIERNLLLFRKSFHSKSNRFSRILNIDLAENVIDQIYFVDFFRYFDAPVSEIRKYLSEEGWIQPGDTGFCSSNCIINDVGIYVHLKEEGYHFYEAQLSWDCRLSTISREVGLKEIAFEGDGQQVKRILKEIGYYNPPIKDAVVIERPGTNGDRILTSYLVSDEELVMSELKEYLEKQLPDYMIPAYFMQIEKIPLTVNGKIDRKALPEPEVKAGKEYMAPRNLVEKKLTEMWAEVLGKEKHVIGINSNFFELGGHSLKATELTLKLQKEFDIKVPIAEIFKTPTIRRLAEYIKEAGGSGEEIYHSIGMAEKKDGYVLSSAQKRMFFLSEIKGIKTTYNMPMAIKIEGRLEKNLMEKAFQRLIHRHESLRTSFASRDGIPLQIINENVDYQIQYKEMAATYPHDKKEVDDVIEKLIEPFNLGRAPLLRVILLKLAQQEHILLVDMHHIISDGMSMAILIREFFDLYQGEKLPGLPMQYKDFAEWQSKCMESKALETQEKYWLKRFKGDIPVLNLIPGSSRQSMRSFAGDSTSLKIDRELTDKIKKIVLETKTTLYIILFTVYTTLLSKYSEQEDIIVGSLVAGRTHQDLDDIVGNFVNTAAIRNFPCADQSFAVFLEEVKENILDAFENQDYPFEELVEKLKIPMDLSRNPLFDAAFAFYNIDMEESQIMDLKFYNYRLKIKTAHFDLVLHAAETDETIQLILEYAADLFNKANAQLILKHYVDILTQVIEDISLKLGDIKVYHEILAPKSNMFKKDQLDFGF